MLVEYSEDIYPYATFQLEENVPAGGDSRCNSAAPLQTFVYHDPRLSTADTLQLREVSSADLVSPLELLVSSTHVFTWLYRLFIFVYLWFLC